VDFEKFLINWPKKVSKKKAEIESEFSKINQTNQIIGQNLREAKQSGDDDRYQSLIGKLRTIKEREEFLQGEYTSLQEQEQKPERERVSKLGEELRRPYAPPPPRGYAPYGLMPNSPNTTANVNYPTAEEDKKRKRDIIAELYNAPAGSREAEQLPAGVRAGVGALPTPESELEFLIREYPNANIAPIDVGGQTEYLIKNPDGTSFTTLDKGIAGTAGMLAVEAPLAAAEIAAGIGTATHGLVCARVRPGSTRHQSRPYRGYQEGR
jgi:hypothetical protein